MQVEKAVELAKAKVSAQIMQTKAETGLPMYMMELVVSAVLGDIRDAAWRESIQKEMKEKVREGKENGDTSNLQKVEDSEEPVQEDEPGGQGEAGGVQAVTEGE